MQVNLIYRFSQALKAELHTVFAWYLLICENTLIQVVKIKKRKKKKEKIHFPSKNRNRVAGIANGRHVHHDAATFFFSRDKMLIDTNMLVFFLGKCVQTAAKTMVVDGKNQKALALLYLASGPLPDAANSSVVPTEFAAEPTTKMKSSKANFLT